MLVEQRIAPDCVVIDAGMTPYHLPKILTWFIAARDWCVMEIGKHVRLNMLRGMFSPQK